MYFQVNLLIQKLTDKLNINASLACLNAYGIELLDNLRDVKL